MSFKDDYPEFAGIEDVIQRARAERSAAIGTMIGNAIARVALMLQRVTEDTAGVEAEHERCAIEADPFLRRSLGSASRY